MKTTVPGLWAIGDTSYAGSAWAGATEAPPGRIRGSGLMNAVIGGTIGSTFGNELCTSVGPD